MKQLIAAAAVVCRCILVNAYTTYPSLLLVIQDMLWSVLPRRDDDLLHEHSASGALLAAAARLSVFAAGCCVALLVSRMKA